MKKIVSCVLFLLFPVMVSAAWWNPFSWFNKPVDPAPIVEVKEEPVKESPVVKKETPKYSTPQVDLEAKKRKEEAQAFLKALEDTEKLKQQEEAQEIKEDELARLKEKYMNAIEEIEEHNEEVYEIYKKCNNIEDEVREEISQSGGFANERQVQGLIANRYRELQCGRTYPTYEIPSAVCNDGTYSYSDNRQGTCSSHGGVWFFY